MCADEAKSAVSKPLDLFKKGFIMKSVLKFAGATATGLFALWGSALAEPCGAPPLPACNVPEPGSLPLVILAIAGAAVVARFLKK
jgi:hypothetical protein